MDIDKRQSGSPSRHGEHISSAEFDRGLGKIIIPSRTPDGMPSRGTFRDAEIDEISALLELYGKFDWSRRPRTFAILRMVNCMDAIKTSVSESLSDVSLPYTEENLPDMVKGARARALFLKVQNLVLTPSAEIEKNPTRHQRFAKSADKYYIEKRELGVGGFGQVDLVVSRASLKSYARKRIPRGRSFKKDNEVIRGFENELKVLKLLSHKHLVKLVGSYTDPQWVTLLMTPVADMNLARYLTADIDLQDRQICLRRFFGCLAHAVAYLHKMEVRHKDIKPQNILVKGRNVLLTDFGTSHNWSDSTRSGTSGTVPVFTRKYCAPEVADYAYRDAASDIWSLGCVFLEMGTVLCKQSMQDLDNHFLHHGTRLPFIRGNNDAMKSWIEVLRKKADTMDDMQPLDLVNGMTEIQGINRPTASQVVNAVSNFEGEQPYHGICCSGDWDDGQSLAEYDYATMVDDVAPDMITCAGLVENDQEIGTIKVVDGKSATDETQSLKALGEVHPGPACQDPKPIRFLGSAKPLHALQAFVEDCVTEVVTQKPDQVPKASMGKESKIWASKADSVLGILNRIDMTRLTCQWPNCGGQETDSATFEGRTALEDHYRSAHQVHEFSYSLLLGDSQTPRASDPTLDHHSNKQIPEDGSAQEWRYTFAQKKPPVRVTFDLGETRPNEERPDTGQESKRPSTFLQKTDKAIPRPKASDEGPGHSASREDGPTRFSLLPSGRRPEPISVVEEVIVKPEVYCFVDPELLNSPGMPANSVSGQVRDGQYQLPKSSLAPSYILASTNRFSEHEVAGFMPNRRLGAFSQPPLFVYGSFMFPSILRRQAETFVSQSGIYSALHQRRLRSDAIDWAHVNLSLQHAAERMTPALLSGYDRWQPAGLSCACIVESFSLPKPMEQMVEQMRERFIDLPSGEVQGFLVFGLAEEALKCCDMLFSRTSLESLYTDDGCDDFKLPGNSEPFRRKTVNVRFGLRGGEVRSIAATTYVWKAPDAKLIATWKINRFVESKSFSKLSGALSSSLWMSEEKELAKAMGITFVLPGDGLIDAVLRKDIKDVSRLLKEGNDVNAPGQGYGSALQAASAEGSEEIVSLLLRRGAMVNAVGGQYENALLAATVRGHEGVVNILVKAGADILKDGGAYVSPIYQAVSHSNVDMVMLLLERGAWLTRNYDELVDLASEKGNAEILNLLDEYDMRDLQQRLPSSDRKAKRWGSDEESEGNLNDDRSSRINHTSGKNHVAMRPAKVLRAVVCKALLLKGSRGKWTGIKAVKLLRTAIKAGLSPQILEDIRPNLSSIQKLLDFLKIAVLNYADEQNPSSGPARPGIAPKHPMGTVTELGDTSDSDGDSTEGRSRRRRPFYRELSLTTRPHMLLSVSDSRSEPENIALPPSGTAINTPTDIDHESSKVICPSCDGRGGRQGAGSVCWKCNGRGRYRDKRCSGCHSTGRMFSERNRCRDCDGQRFIIMNAGNDQQRSESDHAPGPPSRDFSAQPAISRSFRRHESKPGLSPTRSRQLPSASSGRSPPSPRNAVPQSSPSSRSFRSKDPPPPYTVQD